MSACGSCLWRLHSYVTPTSVHRVVVSCAAMPVNEKKRKCLRLIRTDTAKNVNIIHARNKTKVCIFFHINLLLHSHIQKVQTEEKASAVTLACTNTHAWWTRRRKKNNNTVKRTERHTLLHTMSPFTYHWCAKHRQTETWQQAPATHTHASSTSRYPLPICCCVCMSSLKWETLSATKNKDKGRRRRFQRGEWR